MHLGIFAKTFQGDDPNTVLGAVADAGFTVAHYNMVCSGLPSLPDSIPSEISAAISNAAETNGIRLCGVSGTFNMIHPDPEVRRRGLASLDVIARAASAMGTDLITLCTGTRNTRDMWRAHPDNSNAAAWNDLRAATETAVGIAEAHNIQLGLEPELGNVVSSAALARRLIDEMQSEHLRIVFDPANLFDVETRDVQRRIVSESIDLLADRITIAHAKDRALDGSFTTAGQGVLDYDHYLNELKGIEFTGPVVAHGLAASEASTVAQFLAGLVPAGTSGPMTSGTTQQQWGRDVGDGRPGVC
jgi:sugar phosphate isomerase/epimerase